MGNTHINTDTAILDEKYQNMNDEESLHQDVMTTIQKLNDKWEYDEDMELFLRQLPKVRYNSLFLLEVFYLLLILVVMKLRVFMNIFIGIILSI